MSWSKGTTHEHTKYGNKSYFYSSTEDTSYVRRNTYGSKYTVANKTYSAPGMNPAVTSNRTDWTTSGSNDTTTYTTTTNYTGATSPSVTVDTKSSNIPVTTIMVVHPTVTSGGGYTWSGWWDSWDDSPFMAGLEAGADEFGRQVKSAALQIFVGEWSGENSVAGAIGSVLFGLTGLDVYKDFLDLTYHIANFDPTDWHSYADIGMDVVGMLPVLGAIKNVVKGASKTGDALKSGAKAVEALDEGTDATKAVAKAEGAAKQAEHGKDAANCTDNIQCFTRDTLVSTENGLQPIGLIQPGSRVYSYEFESRSWVLREVLERHDNIYDGPVVVIRTQNAEIQCTVYHPFWVISGRDLQDRSVPRELNEFEDQGQLTPGRWVNSHELRAGDRILQQNGNHEVIMEIRQVATELTSVSNLTIMSAHNYSVSADRIFVHNISPCGRLAAC